MYSLRGFPHPCLQPSALLPAICAGRTLPCYPLCSFSPRTSHGVTGLLPRFTAADAAMSHAGILSANPRFRSATGGLSRTSRGQEGNARSDCQL
ncbi:hypothetical protein BD310DRAFT_940666 [Dichomitus squalens]|uniref:Uncharacterized protein n=1 Tax=Dichomitus squalens TaxID=114155 RepID=A0A4Q9PCF1_9APHY|nr:hypothetical protein BD310DRAFT_940666 [Dichomitus squalens]